MWLSDTPEQLEFSKCKSRECIKLLHEHEGDENGSGKKQIVPNWPSVYQVQWQPDPEGTWATLRKDICFVFTFHLDLQLSPSIDSAVQAGIERSEPATNRQMQEWGANEHSQHKQSASSCCSPVGCPSVPGRANPPAVRFDSSPSTKLCCTSLCYVELLNRHCAVCYFSQNGPSLAAKGPWNTLIFHLPMLETMCGINVHWQSSLET